MSITRSDVRAMLDDFKELKAREEAKDRKTKDTLLTPPTPAEWAAYAKTTARVDLGRVWTGMEAALDALEPEARAKVLESFDAYRAKDRRMTADQVARDNDPFNRRGVRVQMREMNDRNRALWNLKPIA